MHRRMTIGFYMMALIGLSDQLTKWLVLSEIADAKRTIIFTGFLNFVLVWNKGVTFGILSHPNGREYMSYVLVAVAVAIIILLGRWLYRTNSTTVAVALGAIMGGAVGNIIDRVRYGAVMDFLDFHFHDYHWYAFNIADASIVTGVALLLLDGMVRGK